MGPSHVLSISSIDLTAANLAPRAELDRAATQPIGLQAAQSSAHTIHLKSGDVTPARPIGIALNQLARSDGGRVHVLLQLDFIPRDAAKAAYEKNGVKLLAYVPDYAWIASVPGQRSGGSLESAGVTWAGALTVNDKLDPMIRSGEWGSWNLAPDGTAAVSVVMHQDEAIETGRALVEKHGGKIIGEVIGISMLMVEMPQAQHRRTGGRRCDSMDRSGGTAAGRSQRRHPPADRRRTPCRPRLTT